MQVRRTATGWVKVRRVVLWAALTAVLVLVVGLATMVRPTAAQPMPTPPGPTPPAGTVAPPDIAGEWSITRSWWRSCPGCGSVVVRTTSWIIETSGAAVRVDRGPRGTIIGDGAGGGLLTLDGLENGAGGTLRFWYGTLRVSPDGTRIEGGFNGSERIINPCGSYPPIVTCFASAGYLNGYRVSPLPNAPTAPAPPTLPAPASPTSAPSSTATIAPSATLAPPSATPTDLPTPRPAPPGHFPYLGR